MANHKSAVKRNLQNQKQRLRNRTVKTRIKNVVKKIALLTPASGAEISAAEVNAAKSVIDKASKKGVIHHRTAARKISRLTKRAARLTAA
ncbi:MAG: 30S ribosomal protein S20 [Desulfosalsimonadaceae bacterium]|nr:30S ribosomal protein S20 [Desulfosalsimonadaceae bacterium]